MFDLELEVAVGAQDVVAKFGDDGAAAVGAAGGGFDEGSGPAGVHGVEEHPGAAIAESQSAGGLRKGAAEIDLFEEVGAGVGDGGLAGGFDPEPGAEGARGGGLGTLFHGVNPLHSVNPRSWARWRR